MGKEMSEIDLNPLPTRFSTENSKAVPLDEPSPKLNSSSRSKHPYHMSAEEFQSQAAARQSKFLFCFPSSLCCCLPKYLQKRANTVVIAFLLFIIFLFFLIDGAINLGLGQKVRGGISLGLGILICLPCTYVHFVLGRIIHSGQKQEVGSLVADEDFEE